MLAPAPAPPPPPSDQRPRFHFAPSLDATNDIQGPFYDPRHELYHMGFAWHVNGDAAALKGWCSDVKGTLSNMGHHSAAPWRKTLAAVMKCQNENVLAMAAHAMATHFGVDVPALCAVNYVKMHCKGKVLKSDAQRRQKPRMTAGDAVHFTALTTAVENLTAEQRNRMAGSVGKAPTPPRPRAGGYKKKELSYEQLE